MPLYPYRTKTPSLGERVFLAPSADVIGDVTVGDDVSFWFQTVVRGDVHWIRIGDRTNIQDGSVLHVTHGTHPLDIRSEVTVGHSAIVHGCTLHDGCLVGMGARVLDGAEIGEEALVGAGAVVPPRMVVPPRTLVLGVPARVARELDDEDIASNRATAARYHRNKDEYAAALGWGTDVAEVST